MGLTKLTSDELLFVIAALREYPAGVSNDSWASEGQWSSRENLVEKIKEEPHFLQYG